jgi:hypothetical protein
MKYSSQWGERVFEGQAVCLLEKWSHGKKLLVVSATATAIS